MIIVEERLICKNGKLYLKKCLVQDINVILNFGRADNLNYSVYGPIASQINIVNKNTDENSLILDVTEQDIKEFEGREFTIQYSAEASNVLDLEKVCRFDNSGKYNFIKNFKELEKYFILFYRQMDKSEIYSILDSILNYSDITEKEMKSAQRFSKLFMRELIKEKGETK